MFAVRSQFNLGIGAFDATVNADPLPDSRFFAWRGQGQYVRRLDQNSLLVLRSDLQLAATNLVPLEHRFINPKNHGLKGQGGQGGQGDKVDKETRENFFTYL